MPTEAVASRLKSAFVVTTAIDEFRGRALPALEARPVAEGQSPSNYGQVLDGLKGQIGWASADVFKKDKVYVHEQANDARHFKRRDDEAGNLRRVVTRARSIFDGCYKPENIEEFGFPRRVSQDSEILYHQCLHLDQRLRVPELPLPDPLHASLVVDPVVIADVVAPHILPLELALGDVRVGRRALQVASLERNEALRFFDQTFVWVSRTAEALFNLADEKELAKRIRTSPTRPGRTEKDPDKLLAASGQKPPDFDQADPDAPLPGVGPAPDVEPAS